MDDLGVELDGLVVLPLLEGVLASVGQKPSSVPALPIDDVLVGLMRQLDVHLKLGAPGRLQLVDLKRGIHGILAAQDTLSGLR